MGRDNWKERDIFELHKDSKPILNVLSFSQMCSTTNVLIAILLASCDKNLNGFLINLNLTKTHSDYILRNEKKSQMLSEHY